MLASCTWLGVTARLVLAESQDLVPDDQLSPPQAPSGSSSTEAIAVDMELETTVVEESPVLQRWLDQPPNVLEEITHTPILPARIQAVFEGDSTWELGVADLQLADRVTLSGSYRQSWDHPDDRDYGSEVRYYLAPMGSILNLAPQLGYRSFNQADRQLSGPYLGAFVVLGLAPGAADLTASYSFLDPVEPEEGQATLASITASYALSTSIRLAARYSWRNSTLRKDSDFGLILEWIP